MNTRKFPPDLDRMNEQRAAWGEKAIVAHVTACRGDRETPLVDILADLRHWADRNRQDFLAAFAKAMEDYAHETRPERGSRARKEVRPPQDEGKEAE